MPIAVTPDFSLVPAGATHIVSVDTAELTAVSQQLSALADRYESSGRRLAPVALQIGALAALDASGQGALAFSSLTVGAATLVTLAAAAQRLATAVRQSAANYEAAEAFASDVLQGYEAALDQSPATAQSLGSAFGYRGGSLRLVVQRGTTVVKVISENKVPLALKGFDVFRQTGVGRASISVATDQLHDTAKSFGLVRRLRVFEDISHEIDPWVDPETGENLRLDRPPKTAADLVQMNYLVSGAHQAVDDHYGGEHYVNEWDHIVLQRHYDEQTGQERVIITLPGTDGELADLLANYEGGTASWTENIANAALLDDPDVPLAQSSAAMQLVDQMLREEGIDAGTPIMLNGYSQGGVVAMSLAKNKEFSSRYNVQVVATQGSPVSDMGAAPPGVAHIRMDNKMDYVPKTQGANPHYQPTEDYSLNYWNEGDPHGSPGYLHNAQNSESFNRESEALAKFFNGDFRAGETTVYAGSSQDSDLTEAELNQQRLLGIAHGTSELSVTVKDTVDLAEDSVNTVWKKTDLPDANRGPSGSMDDITQPVNPTEVYQNLDEGVDWLNDEVIVVADEKLNSALQDITIGDIELHPPDLTWNPGGKEQPPVPTLDDNIKTYSPNPIEVSPAVLPDGRDPALHGVGAGSSF